MSQVIVINMTNKLKFNKSHPKLVNEWNYKKITCKRFKLSTTTSALGVIKDSKKIIRVKNVINLICLKFFDDIP